MTTGIRMETGMNTMAIPMTIDPTALLTLAQWLSPAYPVGAYTYSHGLEWAVHDGTVSDAEGFRIWLLQILEHGAGRNDAILLAAAWAAADDEALQRVEELARALSPSRERSLETEAQGAAFARTTSAIWQTPLPDLCYPVAVGAAARRQDLPLRETLLYYLHGFASNLTSAAIRLVPLGQTEGQTTLAAVTPICADIAERALTSTLDDLGSCTFLADVASMKHETQYSRLFRS